MISRATFVYVLMLALFGAGLWAVLSVGSILLQAPEDLAGKWNLIDASHTSGERTPQPIMQMSIQQSGRFFKITLAGKARSLKMIEEVTVADRHFLRKRVRLASSNAVMEFDGISGSDEFEVRLTGANAGTWIARRIERTYPKPSSARLSPPQRTTTSPTGLHARP